MFFVGDDDGYLIEEMSRCITLTFGDCAENHVGMEQIGKLAAKGSGFSREELERIGGEFHELGPMGMDYCLVILRNVLDPDIQNALFQEQLALDWDKKAYMYGRVVNKNARWNLCYDTESREPDYEKGKGRIIGMNEVPLLQGFMTDVLPTLVGEKGQSSTLKVEGNYYYNVKKTYIGFHGDSERRKVIGLRLGDTSFPLHFQGYSQGGIPIGEKKTFVLNPGDLYIMSEKAVGTDWKNHRLPFTLRHAAGYKIP
jgi:hypothetical protein